MGTNATDADTPDLVTGRSPASFDVVFEAQHERLMRLAWLLCGDEAEAEDAIAEVFARLCRRWTTVNDIRDLDAYLRRAVVNEVRSSLRRRVRIRRVRSGSPYGAAAPDRDLGERERMHRALLQLGHRQRAALVLRFYEDLSEADTARLLRMPVGTVKSTVSRGLERLRRILEEEKEDDDGH
jgi:RNA polymerase sigma-70 factor (sigma-E family)